MTTVLIIALLALLAWAVWTYNRLVRTRNQVNEAWAGIDVQLQRRYDLVPNLVATVKGYMTHESGVLERVTRLRGNPEMELTERAEQESGLSRSIGRLFALAEDYPDLKASEGFRQLHESLVEVEEHLQFARRYYNGSVRDNNNLVEGFPSMVVAQAFRFISASFFEIELASQRAAPNIDLGRT
jgi:LemA protein